MSNLLSTELVHEGEKVIFQEMASDRYDSCIADLVRKTRALFLPDFLIWIIKVNHHCLTLWIKKIIVSVELPSKFNLATRFVFPNQKVIKNA